MAEKINQNLDWVTALEHFQSVVSVYEEMLDVPGVNTRIALEVIFKPIQERYDSGERSIDLFDAMMSVQ